MINLILLVALLAGTLWTIMATRLLQAVIGLAVTSVILVVIMFRLNAPLAAVFELSVCAGLIPVIFITTISFTQRLTPEKLAQRQKEKFSKYWALPVLVLAAGLLLSRWQPVVDFKMPVAAFENNVRNILWNSRHLDLLGQIAILLTGVFGVVILFKEVRR